MGGVGWARWVGLRWSVAGGCGTAHCEGVLMSAALSQLLPGPRSHQNLLETSHRPKKRGAGSQPAGLEAPKGTAASAGRS